MKCIAIQEDDYGLNDSASPVWKRLLLEAGHEVRDVDVRCPDILEQLDGCHGFMWRWAHFSGMGRIAKRLLPVVEQVLNIPVYPDQKTCWHYDDKIAQAYLLRAYDIPAPETWLWFDREGALQWVKTAAYPLVLKLATGAGSSNVRLVRNLEEASCWVERLFSGRLTTLHESQFHPLAMKERLSASVKMMAGGRKALLGDDGFEAQCGYVLFQEFLDGNGFDIRITVIGDRAFGYRRFNRPSDFRASGSGNFDTNPLEIDAAAVALALRTARMVGSQSLAVDILRKGCQFVVSEISYTFVSWVVHACPGYWDESLSWHEGSMWPEAAQLEDFLKRLA